MHRVYENDDLMMYFKKRYCHYCGKVLLRKKSERIVQKGDPDHQTYCHVGTTYKPYGDILVISKKYYCPSCDKLFTCDEQGRVIDAQKHYQKKIVSDEEIRNVYNSKVLKSTKDVKKLRWVLLIPVVGSFICTFYIFNGKLSQISKDRDLRKITFASILIFIGVALFAKFVLSMFDGVDFINDNKKILMLIPSLLSFNIPTLWYVNHTF